MCSYDKHHLAQINQNTQIESLGHVRIGRTFRARGPIKVVHASIRMHKVVDVIPNIVRDWLKSVGVDSCKHYKRLREMCLYKAFLHSGSAF